MTRVPLGIRARSGPDTHFYESEPLREACMNAKLHKTGFFEREKRKSFYLFMSLWIVGFAVFQLIPILWGFNASLTNRMAFSLKVKYVGFLNYLKVFADEGVLYSIYTTFIFAMLNTVIQVPLGFALALVVNTKILGKGFFRLFYYLPYVIPVVATGWILRIFFDKNVGTLNILLLNLGLIRQNISWLGDHTMFSVLAAGFWRVGWSMLIFLGGLATIPSDLYDAADVDGAGALRKLGIITLPMLSPFIAFQCVVSFIYGMQEFILPYLLNPTAIRGGQVTMESPPRETFFILPKGYDLIFNKGRLAYGFAVLWVTFIIILVLSLIFARIAKKSTYSEMDS
jgi:multiple sugar transport system permease protein